jgi:hypothetical protein
VFHIFNLAGIALKAFHTYVNITFFRAVQLYNYFFIIRHAKLIENCFFLIHHTKLTRNYFFIIRHTKLTENCFFLIHHTKLTRNYFFIIRHTKLTEYCFFLIHHTKLTRNYLFIIRHTPVNCVTSEKKGSGSVHSPYTYVCVFFHSLSSPTIYIRNVFALTKLTRNYLFIIRHTPVNCVTSEKKKEVALYILHTHMYVFFFILCPLQRYI